MQYYRSAKATRTAPTPEEIEARNEALISFVQARRHVAELASDDPIVTAYELARTCPKVTPGETFTISQWNGSSMDVDTLTAGDVVRPVAEMLSAPGETFARTSDARLALRLTQSVLRTLAYDVASAAEYADKVTEEAAQISTPALSDDRSEAVTVSFGFRGKAGRAVEKAERAQTAFHVAALRFRYAIRWSKAHNVPVGSLASTTLTQRAASLERFREAQLTYLATLARVRDDLPTDEDRAEIRDAAEARRLAAEDAADAERQAFRMARCDAGI